MSTAALCGRVCSPAACPTATYAGAPAPRVTSLASRRSRRRRTLLAPLTRRFTFNPADGSRRAGAGGGGRATCPRCYGNFVERMSAVHLNGRPDIDEDWLRVLAVLDFAINGAHAARDDALSNQRREQRAAAAFGVLKERKVTQAEVDDEGECVICAQEWTAGETIHELPCGHAFHGECIRRWFERKCNCPICQRAVSGPSPGPGSAAAAGSSFSSSSGLGTGRGQAPSGTMSSRALGESSDYIPGLGARLVPGPPAVLAPRPVDRRGPLRAERSYAMDGDVNLARAVRWAPAPRPPPPPPPQQGPGFLEHGRGPGPYPRNVDERREGGRGMRAFSAGRLRPGGPSSASASTISGPSFGSARSLATSPARGDPDRTGARAGPLARVRDNFSRRIADIRERREAKRRARRERAASAGRSRPQQHQRPGAR